MESRRTWFLEPLVLRLFLSVLVPGILLSAGCFAVRQYFESSLELKRHETHRLE